MCERGRESPFKKLSFDSQVLVLEFLLESEYFHYFRIFIVSTICLTIQRHVLIIGVKPKFNSTQDPMIEKSKI